MRKTIGLMAVVSAMAMGAGCDVEDKDNDGASAADPEDTEGDTEGDTEEEETEGDTDGETEEEPPQMTSAGEPGPNACDADVEGVRACVVESGVECGEQYCEGGEWGACVETAACDPGGGETSTPLVLSFDGASPEMTVSAAASFDNELTGRCLATDWPTAATPWLALDRDGDGGIADGRELFGSGTRMGDGARAQHGFAALAELDDDGNGRITPDDSRFAELLVWADNDGDKRGTGDELRSLADLHVLSIELGYDVDRVCDERGNCGVERAELRFVGPGGAVATGSVIDLHLACQ